LDTFTIRKKIKKCRIELERVAVDCSLNLLDQRVLAKSRELDRWITLYIRLRYKSVTKGR
jgi:hypothetical protein